MFPGWGAAASAHAAQGLARALGRKGVEAEFLASEISSNNLVETALQLHRKCAYTHWLVNRLGIIWLKLSIVFSTCMHGAVWRKPCVGHAAVCVLNATLNFQLSACLIASNALACALMLKLQPTMGTAVIKGTPSVSGLIACMQRVQVSFPSR